MNPAIRIERLAALIREVDGNNHMGASALAETLVSHFRPIPVGERMPIKYSPDGGFWNHDLDEYGRCWWLKQAANSEHDLLMPSWHYQQCGTAGTRFFRFTHWVPYWVFPFPGEN